MIRYDKGRSLRVITFEGADGCGKTTQMKMTSEYLTACNIPHITAAVPMSGGTYGAKIRELLLHTNCDGRSNATDVLLFAAARQCALDAIRATASNNQCDIVLIDRWDHSNVAYQCRGSVTDMSEILGLSAVLNHSTVPDFEFYFFAPLDVVSKRLDVRKKDYFESMGADVLQQRAKDYDTLYSMSQRDHIKVETVDSVEKSFEIVRQKVNSLVRLWFGWDAEKANKFYANQFRAVTGPYVA